MSIDIRSFFKFPDESSIFHKDRMQVIRETAEVIVIELKKGTVLLGKYCLLEELGVWFRRKGFSGCGCQTAEKMGCKDFCRGCVR